MSCWLPRWLRRRRAFRDYRRAIRAFRAAAGTKRDGKSVDPGAKPGAKKAD